MGRIKREEIDWIGGAAAEARTSAGHAGRARSTARARTSVRCRARSSRSFDYGTPSGPDAVTGGFVVHDPALTGLTGRYLYADFYGGNVRSLALDSRHPDEQTPAWTIPQLASFGEDASAGCTPSLAGNRSYRLVAGATTGTLSEEELTGPFDEPDRDRHLSRRRLASVRCRARRQGQAGGRRRRAQRSGTSTWDPGRPGRRAGLLSIVAAPDYASSGKVYVYYTDTGGDIRIDEFTRSAVDPEVADPATRRNVLTIEHAQIANHNGGQLHFGADGCLWVTTGDGGGPNDQFKRRPEPRNAAGEDPADQSEPAGSRRSVVPGLPPPPRAAATRRTPPDPRSRRAHRAVSESCGSAALSSGCAATRPAP